MSQRDPYVWIDPWQAVELLDRLDVTREALAIERTAYERCHAERVRLERLVAEIGRLIQPAPAYKPRPPPWPGLHEL